MITTILFDLDDTLLENSMDNFMQPYFDALSTHLSPFIKPAEMIPWLLKGTAAMITNNNPGITLEQAFDAVFCPGIGIPKASLINTLEDFYNRIFPSLSNLTKQIPPAILLVEKAFAKGYRVVIATNPLFPAAAIHHRLNWAGLPVEKYAYQLVTSYETFHFCKPRKEYYSEIMDILNTTPEQCAMVGNDFENDIIPARQAGLACFHLTKDRPPHDNGIGYGNHAEVFKWLEDINCPL